MGAWHARERAAPDDRTNGIVADAEHVADTSADDTFADALDALDVTVDLADANFGAAAPTDRHGPGGSGPDWRLTRYRPAKPAVMLAARRTQRALHR